MKINLSDPLSRFLNAEVPETTKYDSLGTWKFAMIKESRGEVVFVKPTTSSYIIATTTISDNSWLLGLWSIDESIGIKCDLDITGLKSMMLVVVPPVELSIYNTAVFDKVLSPAKLIEERAFEILCRLINSKEHANKSNKELAIKALQLSSEFQSNYNDLVSFLSKYN